MPDYVVIDEDTKETWLVEVKYRHFQDNFDMKKLILGYLTAVENNLQKKQKIQNYYDDYSHSYDQERTGKYYSVINDLEFETIQPFLKAKKSLEIGCGTGIILKMADQKTKQAFGIDLSPGMVAVSKRKKLKAQTGSATQIPFPNQTFDISYSFKVLAHVPEIKKAILEISRVTKNGGYVVLEFYNPYSLKFVTNFIQHFMVRDNVYIRYDSLKKIKSYLPKNNKLQIASSPPNGNGSKQSFIRKTRCANYSYNC